MRIKEAFVQTLFYFLYLIKFSLLISIGLMGFVTLVGLFYGQNSLNFMQYFVGIVEQERGNIQWELVATAVNIVFCIPAGWLAFRKLVKGNSCYWEKFLNGISLNRFWWKWWILTSIPLLVVATIYQHYVVMDKYGIFQLGASFLIDAFILKLICDQVSEEKY